jgi:hypothetical protein
MFAAFWIFLLVVLASMLMLGPIIINVVFEDDGGKYRKSLLGVFVLCVIVAIGGSLIPSTKEAAAIYLLPKIVNNEKVQKLPENFTNLLNAKMEEWIGDTLKEKKSDK